MFFRQSITRRQTLHLGLAALAGMGACAQKQSGKLVDQDNQAQLSTSFTIEGESSLKERAAAKGLIYGAAGSYSALSSNPEFAAKFAQECAMLVPENSLKWLTLRPSREQFNFNQGDWLAQFADRHDMLFRGHTLVWNQSLPQWFQNNVNKGNAESLMREHLQVVMKHYAGKVHSWDVVNEAIFPQHGRADGLRLTPWLQTLGPNYIDLAFEIAAEMDPQAMLVYNDTRMAHDTPENESRRTNVLKLLERLKSRGVPVHALGLQAHLWGWGKVPFLEPKRMRAFLHEVAQLELKILVTELDVADNQLPADPQIRDRLVAGAYEDYLSVVLDEPAVIAVLTWGLSDQYTWRSKWPRGDGNPVRPLPLDAQMNRKLAWNAIARAFDHTRAR